MTSAHLDRAPSGQLAATEARQRGRKDTVSLHAAVRVEAHTCERLERLCRYTARPALSDERIQVNAAGQVELELKTPWRDEMTHLLLSPLAFMQRLAKEDETGQWTRITPRHESEVLLRNAVCATPK